MKGKDKPPRTFGISAQGLEEKRQAWQMAELLILRERRDGWPFSIDQLLQAAAAKIMDLGATAPGVLLQLAAGKQLEEVSEMYRNKEEQPCGEMDFFQALSEGFLPQDADVLRMIPQIGVEEWTKRLLNQHVKVTVDDLTRLKQTMGRYGWNTVKE